MYNSLAGAPTSVNEQLPNRNHLSHGPGLPDEAHVYRWFLVLEVDEAEATELAELVPVSFLRIQSIAITLDRQLVTWFR